MNLCPDDLLCAISDFLGTPALSHVCHRTWQLLRCRHCVFCVRSFSAARFAAYAQRLPTASLRTLHVELLCSDDGPWGKAQCLCCSPLAQALIHMASAPHLHTVRLDFGGSSPCCPVATYAVIASEMLQTLSVRGACISDSIFLAGLAAAPRLQVLELELAGAAV